MGNFISCTFVPALITTKNTKHKQATSKTTRVIFPTGEVKQYRELVKAAELMLECPNHFMANSQSLYIGHRFSPLAADEELEFGNVYVFFPMRRLNSVVTAADVAVILMAGNLPAKRLSGGGAGGKPGVLLEIRGDRELKLPRLGFDGVEGFQYRLTYCRSRKPGLETINEEPICSR